MPAVCAVRSFIRCGIFLPWVLLALLMTVLWGCAAHLGIYHTVEPGQTLYSIGRAYGVDTHYLARVNGVNDPSNLKVGQRLYIPEARDRVTVPRTVPMPPPPSPSTSVVAEEPATPPPSAQSKQPSPSSKPGPPGRSTNAKSEPPKPSTPSAGDKGRFQWPLKGTVIRQFGTVGGTMNKGIEIACPPGSAVRSAGAGKVIYSGDGVTGYGNLIIIRHDDGFFSVYGFNQKNLVSVGNFVSRGQRIALSGAPPGGGSPRLHFEIRTGKDAVNPLFYLP